LPNGNRRRRKPSQNGVQAIFTNEDGWLVKTAGALAIVTLGTGSSLWAWLAFKASESLTLVSSSLILLVIGVASGAYSLAVRHGRHENDRIRSALYELEVLAEPKIGLKNTDSEAEDNDSMKSGLSAPSRFSKTLAIAVAEAVVLIIVYTGLVEEYAANPNMQNWVRTNISLGAYVLNFNAVFVLVGTLAGSLAFQMRFGAHD
jgi:hypothetical protein